MPDGATKTKLGFKQKQHLFAWLLRQQHQAAPSSTGAIGGQLKFKILASPVAWSSTAAKPTVQDGWAGYEAERDEIFNFIRVHNISGVLLISGDLHYALVTQFNAHPHLFEFSASPLQQFPLPAWIYPQPDRERVLYAAGFKYHFGVVDVHVPSCDHARATTAAAVPDTMACGTGSAATVTVGIFAAGAWGEPAVVYSKTLTAQELTVQPADNADAAAGAQAAVLAHTASTAAAAAHASDAAPPARTAEL